MMKTRIAVISVDSFWDTNIRFLIHSIKLQKPKQKMAVAGRKTPVKSAYNFEHIFLEKLALFLQIEDKKL